MTGTAILPDRGATLRSRDGLVRRCGDALHERGDELLEVQLPDKRSRLARLDPLDRPLLELGPDLAFLESASYPSFRCECEIGFAAFCYVRYLLGRRPPLDLKRNCRCCYLPSAPTRSGISGGRADLKARARIERHRQAQSLHARRAMPRKMKRILRHRRPRRKIVLVKPTHAPYVLK